MSQKHRDLWNCKYSDPQRRVPQEPSSLLVRVASGLTPGRALDLACGVGHNALWLASQGWQVDALDISDIALDRGSREAKRRGLVVRFIQADLEEFKLPPGAYDLVLISLLYLPRAFEEAVASLKEGGVLIYMGFNPRRLVARPDFNRAYLVPFGQVDSLFALTRVESGDGLEDRPEISFFVGQREG